MTRTPAAVSFICLLLVAACSAPPAPEAEWMPLFDGKTLQGWTPSENPESFRVEDGAIACDGPRSHLFYVGEVEGADFRNFELSAEVLTRPGANSGIYFHSALDEGGWPSQGFEVQVNNSQEPHGDYLELKKTSSLYGYRNVYKTLAPDDECFEVRTEVRGKRVRVWLDGTLVVDYREPETLPESWAESYQTLGSGTFALQCHDPGSKVFYRNLRVRALPDDAGDGGPGTAADERLSACSSWQRPTSPWSTFTSTSREASSWSRRWSCPSSRAWRSAWRSTAARASPSRPTMVPSSS